MPRRKGYKFACEEGRAPSFGSFQGYTGKAKLTPEKIRELSRKAIPERIANLVKKCNAEPDSLMRDLRRDAIREWCEANSDSVKFVEKDGEVTIEVLRLPPTRR